MKPLIERLIVDHEHTLRLLACLEHELKGYREDAEYAPKLAIIIDALDYLHNYPDSFHHPLETRLMSRLRPRITESGLRKYIDEIEQEHDDIAGLTINLIKQFKVISSDQVVPLTPLLEAAHRYISVQRQHIQTENRVLIPAIQVYLTEDDYQYVASDLNAHPDPLFGAHAWEVYESLYDFIVNHPVDGVAATQS